MLEIVPHNSQEALWPPSTSATDYHSDWLYSVWSITPWSLSYLHCYCFSGFDPWLISKLPILVRSTFVHVAFYQVYSIACLLDSSASFIIKHFNLQLQVLLDDYQTSKDHSAFSLVMFLGKMNFIMSFWLHVQCPHMFYAPSHTYCPPCNHV